MLAKNTKKQKTKHKKQNTKKQKSKKAKENGGAE
jgi:hypothetical protein